MNKNPFRVIKEIKLERKDSLTFEDVPTDDCTFFNHGILYATFGVDIIKDFCKQNKIKMWAKVLSKSFIELKDAEHLPWSRTIFVVRNEGWNVLMEATQMALIHRDGVLNTLRWWNVKIKLPDTLHLLTDNIYVVGFSTARTTLKPVSDGTFIRYIETGADDIHNVHAFAHEDRLDDLQLAAEEFERKKSQHKSDKQDNLQ